MKQRNLASLLLAGAMTAALLTGPAQAAESPSPQEIAATRLQGRGPDEWRRTRRPAPGQGVDPGGAGLPDQPHRPQPRARGLGTRLLRQAVYHQLLRCTGVGAGGGGRVRLYGRGGRIWGTDGLAPDDPVSPQMACTIMLRYLERDGWTYVTACGKAVELGLAQAETLEGETITRGDMALLLTGSLDYLAYLQTL